MVPYHAHFLGTMNHAWLALATLGVGIGVATPLSLALGLGAYGLGVLFLPEFGPFKKAYDQLRQTEQQALLEAENQAKAQLRANLMAKLSPPARQRREAFSRLCLELRRKLENSDAGALIEESSLAKVEDSHLLLLSMDAEIRSYLSTSEAPERLAEKIGKLREEVQGLQEKKSLTDLQQRLLVSKEDTLRSLLQQQETHERMRANLELAQSELQRLESQVDSLKAELITQPAHQLSDRLGTTLVQVEASQRVLKEGGMVAAPDLNTLLGESQ